MEVVRLTNAKHYSYEKTKILFINGCQAEAEYVAEQLPAVNSDMESVKKLDKPNVRVKVLIGKDLIQYKEVFNPERKRLASSSVGAQKENN